MRSKIIFIFIFFIAYNLLFSQEEFRWAADAEGNVPYIFQDPNNPKLLKGFEVDLANAIAKKMSMKPVFVQNQWDGLIPGLNRGDYDIAINGIEITADRKKEVLFSIPYYYTSEKLVVRSNEQKINGLSDLYGKKIGVLKNSLAERILNTQGGFDVLSYEGEVNAFEDVKNKRIDAALVDFPIALYYTACNTELKQVGPPIGEVVYGAAIRLQDSSLLAKVNNALTLIIQSGELRSILEKWNLWNEVIAIRLNDEKPSTNLHSEFEAYLKSQHTGHNVITTLERDITFLPLFAQGALVTLGISIVSMIIAIFLGLFLAIIRIFGPKFISLIITLFIEIIRGTPLLIQLYIIFYAMPSIGIKFSPFLAAVIGLGVNYAAYEAENYRAGLFAIAKGQMEAAIALGMRRRDALIFIIIPQAFRIVIPPVTNDFISLLKDSSLVSIITMVELTKVYNQVATTYFDFLGTGIIVAAIYLILGLPFIQIAKYSEKHLGLERKRK
jgi:polar amino acid transport system substrate-binding protein